MAEQSAHDGQPGSVPECLLSRRRFGAGAAAIGVSLIAGVPLWHPALVAGQASKSRRPDGGTKDQTRGAGGELRIRQWQAPQELGALTAFRLGDFVATSPVTEPLLNYLPDGTLVPALAREVPTLDNDLIAPDFTSVTYRLRKNVRWSDGEPFTARDVVFTWEWLVDPAHQAPAVFAGHYQAVTTVEAVDDLTVRVSFAQPTPAWFLPFNGSIQNGIYPEHIFAAGGDAANAFSQQPIGTGPYVVESFTSGREVVFAANKRYRERTKPYFATVRMTGGDDPATAALAVLGEGTDDLAWNVALDDETLAAMAANGTGTAEAALSVMIEQVLFNFADPETDPTGLTAQQLPPHPILADVAVRQALSSAIDRKGLVRTAFGSGREPAAKLLVGINGLESAQAGVVDDREAANRLLDEAGWVLDGDVRSKDGRELRLTLMYPDSPRRETIAKELVKDWKRIGVAVRRKPVESSVYFDADPANEESAGRFAADLRLVQDGPNTAFPADYLLGWVGGGLNASRYDNADYDALGTELIAASSYDAAATLMTRMNDLLMTDAAAIPLVRVADRYAIATTLRNDNVAAGPFESLYWNIANWNRMG